MVEDGSGTDGETTTVDVVLSSAPDGLAGFSATVTVGDTEVAEVTNATYSGELVELADTEPAGDGSSVELGAFDPQRIVQPGAEDVLLATIELEGVADGETDVSVSVDQMDSDDAERMDPATRSGTLVVGSSDAGESVDLPGGFPAAPALVPAVPIAGLLLPRRRSE